MEINLYRLKKMIKRAERGEELTIGFLGGSITQGSLATKQEHTYAYRVFSWWQKEYPKAHFHYVNAGIGGTSSHYGVSRAVEDLLMYQPDLVVVDFSVNDKANEFFQETYEGMIRRLLNWSSKPAIIVLNNVYYDTGQSAQKYHNAVASWYQLPCVSMKDTLYQKLKKGIYNREELTPDGLHPNDEGHKLVANEIITFLEQTRACVEREDAIVPIPFPMTANAYEFAKRLTIRDISPRLFGFYPDTREKIGHLDYFKNGWIGKKPGDRIRFEVEASCIAIQYKKTIKRPALCAKVILDNQVAKAVLLDGNFDEDWGDCLCIEPILHHGKYEKHSVEIEVLHSEEKDATPFYLMALILS